MNQLPLFLFGKNWELVGSIIRAMRSRRIHDLVTVVAQIAPTVSADCILREILVPGQTDLLAAIQVPVFLWSRPREMRAIKSGGKK